MAKVFSVGLVKWYSVNFCKVTMELSTKMVLI